MALKPRIRRVPCNAGKGMMASWLPFAILFFSTNRKMAEAAKQILQIKTILDKKRKKL